MKIDPDANVANLLRSWENGNCTDVLDALEQDHPGLTAMFLVVGANQKMLSLAHANTICNLLMERRAQRAMDEHLNITGGRFE